MIFPTLERKSLNKNPSLEMFVLSLKRVLNSKLILLPLLKKKRRKRFITRDVHPGTYP